MKFMIMRINSNRALGSDKDEIIQSSTQLAVQELFSSISPDTIVYGAELKRGVVAPFTVYETNRGDLETS